MTDARRDDALVQFILQMAGEGKPVTPQEIAVAFAKGRVSPKDPPDAWRRWLNPVKQQVLHLAKTGRVEIIRNGRVIDPDEVRGVIRVRLPTGATGDAVE